MKLVLSGALDAVPMLLPELLQITQAREHAALSGRAVRLTGITVNAPLRATVAGLCEAARIDHAFVPAGAALADFGLLTMDMDSTLITIECIDEIADWCGRKAEVAAITEAAMRGEIKDFQESLTRRLALLAGLDAQVLEHVYEERLRLSPGAEKMLAAVRSAGLKTLLVSGGFTYFTDRLKERLGLDYTLSNTLEIVDGKLTGRVVGSIVDGSAKAQALLDTCATLGIEPARAIAMGDGANDLPMMRLAGMSVAYHAKPVVRAQATQAITFGGLDVLLDWFE